MGSYKRSIRRAVLAMTTMAFLPMTSVVSQGGDCHDQLTSGIAPVHQWYLTKAREFERHAERLVHLQTQSLLLSYANEQSSDGTQGVNSPSDTLKQAISDQESRVRYTVEAMARNTSAHEDWHLLVGELVGAYGAMSETSQEVAELIDVGHIDDANAVHRARSMDLYNQIARTTGTLAANIEDVMFRRVIP